MEKYKIEIKRSAVKELKKISRKDLKKILSKIEGLATNSRPTDCKKLSAQEKYRIRYGVYRILYKIEDGILYVYIIKIAHRSRVYL